MSLLILFICFWLVLEFFCSGWTEWEWKEQCDRCDAFCIWEKSQAGFLHGHTLCCVFECFSRLYWQNNVALIQD